MTAATDAAAVRQAFIDDIIEHPEDDAVRLIFADWLEDHGQEERAEFIRVQCEIARMEESGEACDIDPEVGHTCCEDPCPVCGSLAKYAGLVERMEAVWYEPARGFGPVHPAGFQATIGTLTKGLAIGLLAVRRGFAWGVRCPTATWLQHRVELVRSHPIERVELTDKKPVLCDAMHGEDIAGKYRWSRFVGGEEGEVNHYIGGRLIPRDTHMNEAVWSIHATELLALDWLSERLIARAKGLAKEAARDQ